MRVEQYNVYWKNEYIGRLIVDNTTGQHSYEPCPEGVEKVKEETVLLVEMVNGTDGFVAPIPFFQNRLQNMKRIGGEEIGYHTDYFVMKRHR